VYRIEKPKNCTINQAFLPPLLRSPCTRPIIAQRANDKRRETFEKPKKKSEKPDEL